MFTTKGSGIKRKEANGTRTVQFNMVSMLQKKPISAPPHLSEVSRNSNKAEGIRTKRKEVKASKQSGRKQKEAEQSKRKQNKAGESKRKQNKVKGSRTKREEAKGSRTKPKEAEQSQRKQNKAGGSKRKQNKAKGSRTKREEAKGSRTKREEAEVSWTHLTADRGGAVVAARAEEDVDGVGDEGVDGLLDARVDGAARVAVIHPYLHARQQRFRSAEHLAHRHVQRLSDSRHGEEPARVVGQQRADDHRLPAPRCARPLRGVRRPVAGGPSLVASRWWATASRRGQLSEGRWVRGGGGPVVVGRRRIMPAGCVLLVAVSDVRRVSGEG